MNEEIMTLLSNIQSELDQLKAISGAGEASSEQDTTDMPAEDQSEFTEEDIAKLLKMVEGDGKKEEDEDDIAKSAEGATASDTAEERIEDQPEESKANVEEVAKGILMRYLAKSKQKKGSAEVVKMKSELAEVKKALSDVLEAIGVGDEIAKIQKSVSSPIPRNNMTDVQKSIEEIKSLIQPKTDGGRESFFNSGNSIMKSFTENDGEALKFIFSGHKK